MVLYKLYRVYFCAPSRFDFSGFLMMNRAIDDDVVVVVVDAAVAAVAVVADVDLCCDYYIAAQAVGLLLQKP